MGGKVFDYNNDGRMDLLLTDMHSDMSERIGMDREKLKADWITENWAASFLRSDGRSIYGNALYQAQQDGSFVEVSDAANIENYWPWGVSTGDLNADGWQDVFVTASMNYPFRYAPNSVLMNNGRGQFIDAEYVVGVEPRRGGRMTKPWIALNCSGADKAHQHCKETAGELVVHGALGSRSSAIFDVDDDGDLDIVTNEFGDVPMVLISDLAQRPRLGLRFVKVTLQGNTSNRDGLGAVVTVTDDQGRQFVQTHDGQSGYLSQSRIPLYFGLRGAKSVARIEVRWPGGRTSVLEEGLPMNDVLIVTEPE